MTIKIELDPDTKARLTLEAKRRGIAPEAYAEALLQGALASSAAGTGKLTLEELHSMLDGIAEGADKLPRLPTSLFSRESFYTDRP